MFPRLIRDVAQNISKKKKETLHNELGDIVHNDSFVIIPEICIQLSV